MPSWWRRNSNKMKNHHIYEPSKPRNSVKKNREKPKSLDEGIVTVVNSPRKNQAFTVPAISISSPSEEGPRRDYPLPLPLGSPDPSIRSESGVVGLGSESVSASSSTSTSSSLDGCARDHAQFGFFRTNEETKFNSWSRISYPGSAASPACTSPQYPRFWDTSLESPTRNPNISHPTHPLPLPPGSPTGDSQCLRMKWKKGRLLGTGTFGHVYAGFNSQNGQMCAIKEVRIVSDDQASKECLKPLNQEIQLLSQLSHPNIVRYYGSEQVGDKLLIYLEYVSGGSIHKLLKEYGPFSESIIQRYTKQILSGLVYLHGRNTVHRDIKGPNILVDPNGEIKLVDFGMAKHITSCSSTLSFKGSPYWVAPEVIMNAGGYSLPVDIWSLGCTVLEMATSKPPWSSYEGVAAMFKIANSKDLPEIPNHLSEDAKSFIKFCLQRNPSARPTATQLLHHPFVQEQGTNKSRKP